MMVDVTKALQLFDQLEKAILGARAYMDPRHAPALKPYLAEMDRLLPEIKSALQDATPVSNEKKLSDLRDSIDQWFRWKGGNPAIMFRDKDGKLVNATALDYTDEGKDAVMLIREEPADGK